VDRLLRVMNVRNGARLSTSLGEDRADGVVARLAFPGLPTVALDVKKLESHAIQHTTAKRQKQGQKAQA
jgi:hypothetical protein